jgi:hypothetical protein
LPCVSEAFSRGDISAAHARVVAAAFTPERAAALAPVERELAEAASTHTPQELGALVRYVTDAIDGDGGSASDEVLHERRRLHISRTIDGLLATDGLYDADAAEIHLAAINAEMERDRRQHDPRSPAQRRADALTNLLRQSLERSEVGSTRNARPHITVVVDLESLVGAPADLAAMLRAERHGQRFLSSATLERLACDCDISRVITSGRSEVLDVGRTTRAISPALWKALVVRDGHCRAPACHQPPERCEAHHLQPWSEGGRTELANLELLCWYHHRFRHSSGADREQRAA